MRVKGKARGCLQSTIAIISDLHCHHRRRDDERSHLVVGATRSPTWHPVESLIRRIKKEGVEADVLLVAGDLADRIDRKGLAAGWNFAREITKALNAQTIVATLGNHDVDSRRRHGRDPFRLPRRLDSRFPAPKRASRNSYWSKGFAVVDSDTLRILTLNSASHHLSKKAAEHGKFSEQQLSELEDELARLDPVPFQIAVVHHHPIIHEEFRLGTYDVIEGGTQLVRILERFGFHLLVHGHKHFPRLSYASADCSLPVFGAGSFSVILPDNIAGKTRNLFHLLRLRSKELQGCKRPGEIESWEFHPGRGWEEPTFASANLPAITGFGFRPNVAEIANTITRFFNNKRRDILRWSSITSRLPQLRYLVPTDLMSLAEELKRHRLEITPPDLPQCIGRPYEP